MKITKQARYNAKQLFRACLKDGLPDSQRVRATVGLVLERKPRGHAALLEAFQRLVRQDAARRSARVESAIPLQPAFEQSVRQNLARRHGAGLDIVFAHNPALIGGLRIQVGSDVYDGSIQSRLAELEQRL